MPSVKRKGRVVKQAIDDRKKKRNNNNNSKTDDDDNNNNNNSETNTNITTRTDNSNKLIDLWEQQVIPNFDDDNNKEEFIKVSNQYAITLHKEYNSNDDNNNLIQCWMKNNDITIWEAWCDCIFTTTTTTELEIVTTTITSKIHCFAILWSLIVHNNNNNSNNNSSNMLLPALKKHVIKLYQYMPKRYRELYMKQKQIIITDNDNNNKDSTTSTESSSFIVNTIKHTLQTIEGETLQQQISNRNNNNNNNNDNRKNTITNINDDEENDDFVKKNNDDDNDNHDSDDLNDEENNEGIDGEYDDDGVEGTDYVPPPTSVDLDNNNNDTNNNNNDDNNNDDEEEEQEWQQSIWTMLHHALELLSDLLSTPSIHDELVDYLHSIHFTVRCRMAIGTSTYSSASHNLLLTQQYMELIYKYINISTTTTTTTMSENNKKEKLVNQTITTTIQRRSIYHNRARIFQTICQRYYKEIVPDVIYAGVGLLCTPIYLKQSLNGLSNNDLAMLLHKLCLIDLHNLRPESYDRDYLLAIIEDYLVIPDIDPVEELQTYPLFPTERVLWDFSKIPPTHFNGMISLPKLNVRFLSFVDYLWKNFELVRLESSHAIRTDLVDVIKRLRPVVRQSIVEESIDDTTTLKTEFMGWARMALEIQNNIDIIRVNKPLLGERFPSQVIAEFTIDLSPCGDKIRKEWDELGEHDNIFLVGIDAKQMSGQQAPLLRDYIFNNNNNNKINNNKRVADEDDNTFPSRFGVTLVRGCMIIQIRDEAGTILTDPTNENIKAQGTKRILQVALDPAQYYTDQKSQYGTDIYNGLNVVVRREGRANNFRSILNTIRSLMIGTGSINRVVPIWLQNVILGYGNPNDACYTSKTIQEYAFNTVGVAKPDTYLDYGDTFLNEEHVRESFKDIVSNDNITVDDGSKSKEVRVNYKVRVIEKDGLTTNVEAVSYPFPKGINGNPVRFTPRQVAAIRSGLSPGLSLIVGPPGTGKTDVAVQIIASLYHSFPTQRTIVITHSNAALNDIFTKVMARGDVEERYLVRLGAGERDLMVESTHDFTRQGRVAYSFSRRGILLEEVQQVSESLGISGRAERGADGSPAYTCETAEYFNQHQILKRVRRFKKEAQDANVTSDESDVSSIFPFVKYFKLDDKCITFAEANEFFFKIQKIFDELAEYRPLELLRTQRQRSDYLIMKQARVVAMTCTHAAIARSHLIELGFQYDNVVVEEAGQMLEIETFIPLLLQRGEAVGSMESSCRLKRVCLMGDHNQLPPVIQNANFAKYSNMDQSMFSRLIRLGVPYIQLDKQGRARPEIAKLYSWRYDDLGDLDKVLSSDEHTKANAGFVHTFQVINVENFEGKGETSPTAFFYQNLGEAEFAVALFQYMVLIGYSSEKISILTTYNGQKALINDILSQRCGDGTPLAGIRPRAVSTVDQYQGQQNDIILLSLVRTEHVGHLRDIRRLVVAMSRARLGLYVFCRQSLFDGCYSLQKTFNQLSERPNKLQLLMGENYPSDRKVMDEIPEENVYEVDDVTHMGSIVHQMQEDLINSEIQG